jgi:UDP-N-acetylglucosamine 1-carboxyvinyltransferase
MEYFEVAGGHRLSGSVQPQGAKNEALQVIAAVLLSDQAVVLHNVPDILDVNRLIALLERLGVQVERMGAGSFSFQAAVIDVDFLLTEEAQKLIAGLRGSVMILGPLLARFGRAYTRQPGGDKIGRRRLDTHFVGFQALGAKFEHGLEGGLFALQAPNGLSGTYMLLDEASVTGTANILMAAVLAKGSTTIYNAACEPYIQQLCKLLVNMGAFISGIGSNLLVVQGVEQLHGATHTLLADMIEVGSFIGLAAMTQSEIRITNVDTPSLGLIPATFRRLGVQVLEDGNDLLVPAQDLCEIDTNLDGSILTLADHTWPGLTPDLLSILLTVATQCQGTVLIHQKMFESRLFFTDKLIDMGARIILCDPHRATVIGLARRHALRGIHMTSPDIRAGVALLIAALSAQGTSRIYNIEQIDRGYERIDTRLQALGAQLTRVVD